MWPVCHPADQLGKVSGAFCLKDLMAIISSTLRDGTSAATFIVFSRIKPKSRHSAVELERKFLHGGWKVEIVALWADLALKRWDTPSPCCQHCVFLEISRCFHSTTAASSLARPPAVAHWLHASKFNIQEDAFFPPWARSSRPLRQLAAVSPLASTSVSRRKSSLSGADCVSCCNLA